MPTKRRKVFTKTLEIKQNKLEVRTKKCGCKHITNNPPHKSNNEGIINNRTMN